jgi:hypothetical protein
MSSDTQKSLPLPEDLRDALIALGSETPPDEREFSARLHRRLAAAGPPPVPGTLERAWATAVDFCHDLLHRRSLLTGAVLGALATATLFMILTGGHPLRDATPTTGPEDETADVDAPGLDTSEHKALRAVGDRRITRDRLGEDIGAERPERAHLPAQHAR